MKVLIINNLYKPYGRGGAEKYVEIVSGEFLRQGREVVVISTKPFFGDGKEEKNVYYLKSFYSYLNKIPYFFRFIWHLFNIFNFVKYYQIKKIVKKEKPNIVISNNLIGLGFFVPMVFKKLNLKHVHVLHDIQLLHPSGLIFFGDEKKINTLFSRIYQKINSFLFSSVKYIVAPSDWIINIHTEKGFFKSSMKKKIFNPVDINFLENSDSEKTSFDFLYVGQIEEHKGVDMLLKTFNEIIKDYNNYRLTLIGTGSILEKLREKYSSENISFLGRVDKENILNLMKKSSCLVVPSLCYENSPTVIYEAAFSDLDFIYSDFGGASEIGAYFGGSPFLLSDSTSLKKLIYNFHLKNSNFSEKKEKANSLKAFSYIKSLIDFIS